MSIISQPSQATANDPYVCPPSVLPWFDNFLRPLFHPPQKVFGPHVAPGMRVLDLGCGGGFSTVHMAAMVGESGEIVAADLQPKMLELVGARIAKAGFSPRVHLHQCEAERIGATGPFDFALAFWMLHETPDPQATLTEIFELLKPGGRLLVVEPKGHVSRKAIAAEQAGAETVGFKVIEPPKIRLSHALLLEKP